MEIQEVFYKHPLPLMAIPHYAWGIYLIVLWVFVVRRHRTVRVRGTDAPTDVNAPELDPR